MKQLTKKNSTKQQRRDQARSIASRDSSKVETFVVKNAGYKSTDTSLRRAGREGTWSTRINDPRLSQAGVAFLKCAFAPPDFQASAVAGVPDSFMGPSLVKRHRYISTLTFSANNDLYFLLAPAPGVAYFLATVAVGTPITSATVFHAYYYGDVAQLYTGTSNAADVAQQFRYVSNHFEIIPTVNQTTWSGGITAWKINLKYEMRPGGASTTDMMTVTGLQGTNATMQNCYSGPFINGIYTGAYSANCDFNFTPAVEAVTNLTMIPPAIEANDFGALGIGSGWMGLDNGFETTVIKVSGVTAAQTGLIKTWSCVEYQVNPNSGLYSFVSLSPRDEVAIALYREIIQQLPLGVPFEMNEGFWDRVLRIISGLSGMGAYIPGPVGMVSRGVNLVSNGVRTMLA